MKTATLDVDGYQVSVYVPDEFETEGLQIFQEIEGPGKYNVFVVNSSGRSTTALTIVWPETRKTIRLPVRGYGGPFMDLFVPNWMTDSEISALTCVGSDYDEYEPIRVAEIYKVHENGSCKFSGYMDVAFSHVKTKESEHEDRMVARSS